MAQKLTPALLGARLKSARLEAGLTQTELGAKIGASRFWVTAFENGKETVELGLALRALSAVGIALQIVSKAQADPTIPPLESIDLDSVLRSAGLKVTR